MRPTTTTDCFHLCRSNPEDPESVFIMVPIIHPGRFRYNVGSRCTQNLAQMQWCLFFLLTSTAVQVVTESSNCKRSTLVERILSTADTALKTDAGGLYLITSNGRQR
jgi:hypothetical protein